MNSIIKKMENSNERMQFKRITKTGYPSTVSFGKYANEFSSYDMGRKELYNMGMMYILSYLVLVEKLKFILLPIAMFDVSLNY